LDVLRRSCKANGLPVYGTKADLLNRLLMPRLSNAQARARVAAARARNRWMRVAKFAKALGKMHMVVSYLWGRISRFHAMHALMLRLPVRDVRMIIYREANIVPVAAAPSITKITNFIRLCTTVERMMKVDKSVLVNMALGFGLAYVDLTTSKRNVASALAEKILILL
tara:strand:+ start:552 stop:1055 length:504 start_codon:yes stop_codon:yes gene_type:complete